MHSPVKAVIPRPIKCSQTPPRRGGSLDLTKGILILDVAEFQAAFAQSIAASESAQSPNHCITQTTHLRFREYKKQHQQWKQQTYGCQAPLCHPLLNSRRTKIREE